MTDMEQKILKEFFRQVLSVGYDATSLKSICQALSISTGHLSYYFPKKEQMQMKMMELAVRKYRRILKEQLSFIDEDSLPFYLTIEYLIFSISCEREEVRRTYYETQKYPSIVMEESKVLNEAYGKVFADMGLPVPEDHLKLAHAELYLQLINSYKMLADGDIHIPEAELFERAVRTFLWQCGMEDVMIHKSIEQTLIIARMLDKSKVYERAFQLEDMDYDEI